MNPNTYPWTQADEEDYDSNASPEDQAALQEAELERMDAEREALDAFNQVPSYFERHAVERAWREFLAV